MKLLFEFSEEDLDEAPIPVFPKPLYNPPVVFRNGS